MPISRSAFSFPCSMSSRQLLAVNIISASQSKASREKRKINIGNSVMRWYRHWNDAYGISRLNYIICDINVYLPHLIYIWNVILLAEQDRVTNWREDRPRISHFHHHQSEALRPFASLMFYVTEWKICLQVVNHRQIVVHSMNALCTKMIRVAVECCTHGRTSARTHTQTYRHSKGTQNLM